LLKYAGALNAKEKKCYLKRLFLPKVLSTFFICSLDFFVKGTVIDVNLPNTQRKYRMPGDGILLIQEGDLIKFLDSVVILLEGGTYEDIKAP
jgi:hypothetical protein